MTGLIVQEYWNKLHRNSFSEMIEECPQNEKLMSSLFFKDDRHLVEKKSCILDYDFIFGAPRIMSSLAL